MTNLSSRLALLIVLHLSILEQLHFQTQRWEKMLAAIAVVVLIARFLTLPGESTVERSITAALALWAWNHV